MKLCFAATLELSTRVFLAEHMRRLQDTFDISIVVNTEDVHFLEGCGVAAQVIPVPFLREISPFRDFAVLKQLFQVFRQERFDIVHSIMPKSGLLSMMAGLLARVPVRIHTFTGQLWKNDTGVRRTFFKFIDKVIAGCATHILVDSPSQREFIIGEGIVSRKKSAVLGSGSICGVDLERFQRDAAARERIRNEHGVGRNDIVFLYLGRLKRDKGVLDLARAFAVLCRKHANAHLLIVGPDEEDLSSEVESICSHYADRLHILGFTDAPEQYFSAADVFCLPSYREGFGQVIAEAGAMGLPSIGSHIYGITDALEDGVSGFLFEAGAHHDLMQKMTRFVDDPTLITAMGAKAGRIVAEKFSKEKVTSAMVQFYRKFESH